MLPRDAAALTDMALYAEKAQRLIQGQTRAAFLTDELRQLAAMRCIEVIGEAAARVSAPTQHALPGIPWTRVVGMRNHLIHRYDEVDLDRLWQVLSVNLPELLKQLALRPDNPLPG